MNFLSWLLVAAVALWFVIALVRLVKNKGGCSCGCSGRSDPKCGENCGACSCGCGKAAADK